MTREDVHDWLLVLSPILPIVVGTLLWGAWGGLYGMVFGVMAMNLFSVYRRAREKRQ